MWILNEFDCFDLDNFLDKAQAAKTIEIKVGLSNVLPSRTDIKYTDIVEIVPENGYMTGGNTIVAILKETEEMRYLVLPDTVFLASGCGIRNV